METLYIKKQSSLTDPQQEQFVVPAVGIKTQEGLRLIPHPYGTETTTFDTLDTAIANCHRAGYAAEFDGKHYPLPARQGIQRPALRQRPRQGPPAMQWIEQSIPLLQDQLNDNVPSVVANAAYALGELKDEGAIPGLLHALSNDDATVRKNAAEALAKLGKPALTALQHALKDKHWVVRHSALTATLELVAIGFELLPELLPDVLPLLKDDSWLVRSQAALVFGQAAKTYYDMEEKKLSQPGKEG